MRFTTYSPWFSASCLLWLMSNTRVRLDWISEGVLRHVSLASFHFRGLKSCSEKADFTAFSLRMKGEENETGSPVITKPWENGIMSCESPRRLLSLRCHVDWVPALCPAPSPLPSVLALATGETEGGGTLDSLFQRKEIQTVLWKAASSWTWTVISLGSSVFTQVN